MTTRILTQVVRCFSPDKSPFAAAAHIIGGNRALPTAFTSWNDACMDRHKELFTVSVTLTDDADILGCMWLCTKHTVNWKVVTKEGLK